MEPSVYREKWLSLRKRVAGFQPAIRGRDALDTVAQLSRQIAFSFVDKYYQHGRYEAEYIDLLCEMATYFPDEELNSKASSALFEIIVEKLCDDFEDMPVEIYCRVMSQVISYCRSVPQGASLDKKLTDFGILSFDDLHKRAALIHARRYSYDITKPPGKIILLSRVTIGADVAILSVMIQRFMRIFPQAEIIIIGSSKLNGVFGGNNHIRICPLNYARSGGLFERFSSWYAALDILAGEMPPGRENQTLLIDSDSRISQLGVLPLTHGDNYLFFNSRDYTASAKNACMAELTNSWIDRVFGMSQFAYPTVWTLPSISLKAQKLVAQLRCAGCGQIIAVNLGVGTNPRKRINLEFEGRLLHELLKEPRTVVLLDKGFGKAELSQSEALLFNIGNRGFDTVDLNFDDSKYPNILHGLIAVECTVGQIAALIAECDEFIGYDSACQHIAAAVQTPTLTIFAGSNDMHFVRRWSACGNVQRKIVHVDTITDPQNVNTDEVISRILAERQKKESKFRILDTKSRPAFADATAEKALRKSVPDVGKHTL